MFLSAGHAQSTQSAGPKIALRFPRLFVCLSICVSALITCEILHYTAKMGGLFQPQLGCLSYSSAIWCLMLALILQLCTPTAIFICYCISRIKMHCISRVKIHIQSATFMYCCMIAPDKGQNSTNIHVQLELCMG